MTGWLGEGGFRDGREIYARKIKSDEVYPTQQKSERCVQCGAHHKLQQITTPKKAGEVPNKNSITMISRSAYPSASVYGARIEGTFKFGAIFKSSTFSSQLQTLR